MCDFGCPVAGFKLAAKKMCDGKIELFLKDGSTLPVEAVALRARERNRS